MPSYPIVIGFRRLLILVVDIFHTFAPKLEHNILYTERKYHWFSSKGLSVTILVSLLLSIFTSFAARPQRHDLQSDDAITMLDQDHYDHQQQNGDLPVAPDPEQDDYEEVESVDDVEDELAWEFLSNAIESHIKTISSSASTHFNTKLESYPPTPLFVLYHCWQIHQS